MYMYSVHLNNLSCKPFMISALQIVTLTAQCLLYLSLEAVSKATILHILIHQAGGGAIIAIGNQGQDVPMMIPKGQYP